MYSLHCSRSVRTFFDMYTYLILKELQDIGKESTLPISIKFSISNELSKEGRNQLIIGKFIFLDHSEESNIQMRIPF